MKKTIIFSALCLLGAQSIAGPDYAREQRLSDEIVDAIMDGDAVDLVLPDREFLGVFTEADEPKGNVIIVHGRGFHPDWPTVIQPLRVGLTEHGWNTMSLQMPVLEKTAKYNDYVPLFDDAMPRIESAIAHLKSESDLPIILVAHSCGSHMAHHWIHEKGDDALNAISAYVGIGMGATDYKQPMVEPFALDKMKMPVLDLYGSSDYPAVIRMADDRKDMMDAAGNPKSAQIEVDGAAHYFDDHSDELVETVATWLDTL